MAACSGLRFRIVRRWKRCILLVDHHQLAVLHVALVHFGFVLGVAVVAAAAGGRLAQRQLRRQALQLEIQVQLTQLIVYQDGLSRKKTIKGKIVLRVSIIDWYGTVCALRASLPG